ncbi:MAG: AAA family ATPase, partial [Leptospiraceae bacterium]|nr:AAA family ATPase [Leptospiraceae bacterium]
MVKNIPGYSIKNVLYSGKSLILNANREKDGFPVVIKLPSSEYPSQTDWLKLKKEFSIGTKLNHEGITKYLELVSHNNGYALIMEKLEKMTLSAYLKQSKFHLESLLKISISLCEIFQYIHLQGVIHKDIKPDNIIIEPDTLKIKILDFGIASDVGRDIETNIPTKMLAGTLAYISPEQTGRMNRSVDNRSDIYSLGITFYEMFSGSPPFTTVDSLEMLHFHMAKPAPVINNEKIPSIVDKIIQKMILKNPEERYKSCLGIQKDLTRVLESIQKGETPKDFHLGSEDYSTTLLIPEKLYGRTGDIIKLNKVFKSVSSGKSKLLLVSGYSGIGKSGLIGEVQKPLVEERGFFISGKFDQFQKNLPYKGLIFAFQDLISQLLISDQSSIDSWKIKILESIQNNGKILTDVIPDLELLIGKQPEVSELDPVQSQNRFNLVFENFIKSISSAEIPLVIFLDDLQWADKSTLNLLEVIFSGTDIEGLLVIGAFRDNEVDEAHPLKITLSNLSKEGFEAEEIHLSPLTLKDVTELVIDCLSLNREDSLKLAEVVHSKSGGNPFFLRLLLQNMWVNHFINQNEKGNWSIDFSGISGMEITDNVIDLAIKKIQSTDNDIFDLLTFSSCIGYKFESGILAQLFNKAEEEIQNILKKGLREELLTVQNEGELVEYRFIHDRIQQAYYSLLTDDQLVNFHYKIGNYFLEKGSEKEIEEAIFDITDHLNKSISVINNSDELEKLLNLNLKTGHKAKVSSAYQASLSYFQNAIKCLEKLTSN